MASVAATMSSMMQAEQYKAMARRTRNAFSRATLMPEREDRRSALRSRSSA
jgi:hypothetical protein